MSSSRKRRGRTGGSNPDPFAMDDDEVQVAQLGIPLAAANAAQVLIPSQLVSLPAVATPPHGGYGMSTSFAGAVMLQSMEISLSADVMCCYGLDDEEHQQALLRVFQTFYKDGSPMMRESIKYFCEGLTFSVRNTTDAIAGEVARCTNELRLEHSARFGELEAQLQAKTEEADQLRQEKEAEVAKVSRLSEQVDSFSVNEASLRNELEESVKAGRDKQGEIDRLLVEVNSLKEKVTAVESENRLLSSAADQDRTKISRLEEEASKFAEKQDQYASLRETVEKTTQFVNAAQGMCQQGGPFFNYVTGHPIECPVLCNSGSMVPFKALVETWAISDGYFDGSAMRTFSCANTNYFITSIAPRSHVELVHYISWTIGVSKKPLPCVIEYLVDTQWVAIPLFDMLEVLSRVCRIYRRACVGPEDTCMLNGQLVFTFVLQIDDENQRTLMISVATHGTGLTYEGRLRLTDSEWNPFPNMKFRE